MGSLGLGGEGEETIYEDQAQTKNFKCFVKNHILSYKKSKGL